MFTSPSRKLPFCVDFTCFSHVCMSFLVLWLPPTVLNMPHKCNGVHVSLSKCVSSVIDWWPVQVVPCFVLKDSWDELQPPIPTCYPLMKNKHTPIATWALKYSFIQYATLDMIYLLLASSSANHPLGCSLYHLENPLLN